MLQGDFHGLFSIMAFRLRENPPVTISPAIRPA
jgi:hypothetical protein